MGLKSSYLIDEIKLLLKTRYLNKETNIGVIKRIPTIYNPSIFYFINRAIYPVGIWIEGEINGTNIHEDYSFQTSLSEMLDFIKSILITNNQSKVDISKSKILIMDVNVISNITHYRFEIYFKGDL